VTEDPVKQRLKEKTMKKWLMLAVIVVSLSIAYAANVSDMKAGLWSVHTTTINNPGNQKSEGTYTLCRNNAFDEAILARAKNMLPLFSPTVQPHGHAFSATVAPQCHCFTRKAAPAIVHS
jgi:hypothetical protein